VCGASTVEAAIAIAALVVVLVLCLAGVSAVLMQVRCVDAAREAARLAARGDDRCIAEQRHGVCRCSSILNCQ
jgi:Flp pilus assembly protein TadG